MKIAILTGGSKGLGKELLTLLETAGWLVHEVSRSGDSAAHISCDLSDVEQTRDMIHFLLDPISTEPVDEIILINNAAVLLPIVRFSNIHEEEVLRSVHTNVVAPLLIVREFMQQFRDRLIPKTIVHISSGAARKGYAGWSLYCAGKAAIENALNAIYEEEKFEAAPFRVVNVNPFVMDTEMQDAIRNSDAREFPARERYVQFKNEGVLLSARTVAEAILVLVEDYQRKELYFDVKASLPT